MEDALIWNDKFRVYRSFKEVYIIKVYKVVRDYEGKAILNKTNIPKMTWETIAVLDREENKYSFKLCKNADKFLLEDLHKVNETLGVELLDEQTIQKLEAELVLERLMRKK